MKKLFILFLVLFTSNVNAHSWYPMECCSNMDCAPVEKVIFTKFDNEKLPNMIVTTKFGTATVPHDIKFRVSKDSNLHACIVKASLKCIFVPPLF